MAGDPAPCCRLVRQHEDPGDDEGLPAETLARGAPGQPDLLIVSPIRLLEGGQRRLDLDDQEHAADGEPAKDVDRPPLAELRVADLDGRVPPEPRQTRDRCFDESCVALVHEPIELTSAPGQTDHEPRVQCGCDAFQPLDGDTLNAASLDSGYSLLAHPGGRAQISLTPMPAAAQRADPRAEMLTVHRRAAWGRTFAADLPAAHRAAQAAVACPG